VARRVRPAAMLLLAWGISSMSGEAGGVADYNGGTEAYARGEFEEAVDKLKGSLATSDLEVQQKAYYNLGNSLYRVGQMGAGEDPKKTIEAWEKALKAYDDALALDAADEDARFNRDLVQRKLDELKKQQEQKNPPQDPKDQDKKDQEKKDGEQGDEEQQGEPKDQQGKESGEGSEKDGKQGESEGKDGEQKDAEPEDGKEAGEEKPGEEKSKDGKKADEGKDGEEEGMKGQQEKSPQEPAKPSGEAGEAKEGGKEGDAGSGSPTEARKAGEMSREEAIRLLETLANDERLVIPVPLSERNREPQKGGTGTRKTW
jgi:Ca-activated chloride channel family protein